MDEIEYDIFKRSNGIVEITALVSYYGFRPPGKREDWVKYAKEQAKHYNWPNVILYEQQQDKETGYCSKKLVCEINA